MPARDEKRDETRTDRESGESGVRIDLGGLFGGLLGGFGDLVTKLGSLAEKGEEIRRSGELKFNTADGRPGREIKGVYGFSVKVGGLGGEEAVSVEPFGNIKSDAGGTATVQDVHEPMVDVFEEADHVQVVAELPGIDERQLSVELEGDILTIHGERPDKKYHKEVLLPWPSGPDRMSTSCRHGVVEIRIEKP